MKGINELTAEQIKHWDCQMKTEHGWKLARPIGIFTKFLVKVVKAKEVLSAKMLYSLCWVAVMPT